MIWKILFILYITVKLNPITTIKQTQICNENCTSRAVPARLDGLVTVLCHLWACWDSPAGSQNIWPAQNIHQNANVLLQMKPICEVLRTQRAHPNCTPGRQPRVAAWLAGAKTPTLSRHVVACYSFIISRNALRWR